MGQRFSFEGKNYLSARFFISFLSLFYIFSISGSEQLKKTIPYAVIGVAAGIVGYSLGSALFHRDTTLTDQITVIQQENTELKQGILQTLGGKKGDSLPSDWKMQLTTVEEVDKQTNKNQKLIRRNQQLVNCNENFKKEVNDLEDMLYEQTNKIKDILRIGYSDDLESGWEKKLVSMRELLSSKAYLLEQQMLLRKKFLQAVTVVKQHFGDAWKSVLDPRHENPFPKAGFDAQRMLDQAFEKTLSADEYKDLFSKKRRQD